ncbi:hypothetical protein AFE_1310 [Acidithiobacillus ferrooxidans ATCC 23270]|uniref:Uncharacterized protein n=1 Tax=Acidithiobacillus ferrooxidans (strain ATCC 23270 / DSM 14882 / CIP 104768 / NCIMB 8455) TaxID=243159 RepID=B7J8Z2_ACIF2|nr:hypothetical protein AFE_1310 [Acidithiobacillus ferrooxidans ATCC 23270]
MGFFFAWSPTEPWAFAIGIWHPLAAPSSGRIPVCYLSPE